MSRSLPRRDFVKSVAIGGLVITVTGSGCRRLSDEARGPAARAGEPFEPVVYVRLDPSGTVTIVCPRSEMGQGIRTTLAMIIADEMEADWKDVVVAQAPGDEKKYGTQNTDGSTSIRDFLPKYREAGAIVRTLLEAAAAKEWNVPVAEVEARNGHVVHASSKRALAFGKLVATASALPIPAAASLVLKKPSQFRYIGKDVPERGPPGHDHGASDVRPGPAARRHEGGRGGASSGVRRQGGNRRLERGREGAWRGADRAPARGHAAHRVPDARRRGRGGEEHLGRNAGPQEAQGHVDRRTQRELRLGAIPRGTGAGGTQARQGRALAGQRGPAPWGRVPA